MPHRHPDLDERFSLDTDPEEALGRILAGGGVEDVELVGEELDGLAES